MKATFYIDVLSSWCLWAEPAWDELKTRFAGQVKFDWKIALINPGDLPVTREECLWYYRRSATVMGSKTVLNADWFEPERRGDYRAPNLVADAGRDFGATDDRLYRALAHAGMIEGRKIGDIDEVAAIGAAVINVAADELLRRARSDDVRRRVEASTAEFHAHRVNQRPTFILENEIGDKTVIAGLATAPPLIAAVEAMLADSQAYADYAAKFGAPPAQKSVSSLIKQKSGPEPKSPSCS
jgi:predicted DsbA family dithiol-disulfide isomerase